MDDGFEMGGLTDQELEMEVRSLAARVAASTCQFLLAVAEYDRRQAFQAWDCHDMAAWLSWKCGICAATARQYVAVARALSEHHRIRDRFAAGRLSYSQVRAICRVVDADTEQQLLDLAEVSTAAQLEKITRALRRCTQTAADTEARRHALRYLRYHTDDDGNLVGTFCLPPEAGALLSGAIEAAVERDRIADAESDGARDPYAVLRADALVDLVAAATAAGSETGEPPFLVNVIVEQPVLTQHPPGPGGICQVADGPGLADDTARRVACDAATIEIVESPTGDILDVGRRTRRVGRRLRRALHQRDRGCRFPGCGRAGQQAHHIIHWADGGPTNLDNLVSLCWHHHRRVHEAGYQIHPHPDGQLDFTAPDGRLLPAVVTPLDPDPVTLHRGPHPDAYQNNWDGTRLDLPTIIEGLLYRPPDHQSLVAAAR